MVKSKSYDFSRELSFLYTILCIKSWKVFKKSYYVLLSLIVFFNMTMIVGLFFDFMSAENMKYVLDHSRFYFGAPAVTMKYFLCFYMREKLLKLNDLFIYLDVETSNQQNRLRIHNAGKKSRNILLFYSASVLAIISSRIFVFFMSSGDVLMMPVKFPFVFPFVVGKSVVVFLHQFIILLIMGLQGILSDMYSPCYFVLLNAHTNVLSRQIRVVTNRSDMISVIKKHIITLRIYEILGQIVNKTCFVQVLVASACLCANIMSATLLDMEVVEIIFCVFYSCAIVTQILPICYFVSQFLFESKKLSDAVYGSNWTDKDSKIGFDVLLMMQRCQNLQPILAGGIIPVTLPTFIFVLRFAYSLTAIVFNVLYKI